MWRTVWVCILGLAIIGGAIIFRLIPKSSTSVTASIANSEIATHAVISAGPMVITTGKADRLPIARVIQENPVPVPVPAIKSVDTEPSPVVPPKFVSRHWHDPLDSNAKADQQLAKLGKRQKTPKVFAAHGSVAEPSCPEITALFRKWTLLPPCQTGGASSVDSASR